MMLFFLHKINMADVPLHYYFVLSCFQWSAMQDAKSQYSVNLFDCSRKNKVCKRDYTICYRSLKTTSTTEPNPYLLILRHNILHWTVVVPSDACITLCHKGRGCTS